MKRKRNSKELSEPEDDEFEVEDILKFKYVRGRPTYLIKWKGYPSEDNTWEPEENLTNLSDFTKKMASLKRSFDASKQSSRKQDKSKTQTADDLSSSRGSRASDPGSRKSRTSDTKEDSTRNPRKKDKHKGEKEPQKHSNKDQHTKALNLKDLTLNGQVFKDPKHQRPFKKDDQRAASPLDEAVEVEDLLDYKPKFKKDYFLVRWKGDWEDSWEPRNNLLIVGDLMNKMIDLKMGYLRVYGNSEMEDETFVTVQSIRISGTATLSAVVVEMSKDGEKRVLVPLQEVRQRWPQQLLDFLLSRLRLKTL